MISHQYVHPSRHSQHGKSPVPDKGLFTAKGLGPPRPVFVEILARKTPENVGKILELATGGSLGRRRCGKI
jgi:hypothetical protein